MSSNSDTLVYASPHHVTHTTDGSAEPVFGKAISILLTLSSVTVLAFCFSRRLPTVKLQDVALVQWILLATYGTSYFYIVVTALIGNAFGYNTNLVSCGSGIFICLSAYVWTKVLIYLFMVERVRVVHSVWKPRLQDKLYLFNTFIVSLPFLIIVGLSFFYRVSFIDDAGVCHIGLQRRVLIALLLIDVAANMYLTILFIIPLTKLQTFVRGSRNTQSLGKLKALTIRTLIGCILCITSATGNSISLLYFGRQAAWLCMVFCNIDVMFCVIVLHLITKKDFIDDNTKTTPKPSPDYTSSSRSKSFVMADLSKKHKGSVSTSQITVTRSFQIDSDPSVPSISELEAEQEAVVRET